MTELSVQKLKEMRRPLKPWKDRNFFYCPECDTVCDAYVRTITLPEGTIILRRAPFCYGCGQALDWENGE